MSAQAAGCPLCDEPLAARFCEFCGHDSTSPVPDPPPTPEPAPIGTAGCWSVEVVADRDWYDRVARRDGPDVATVTFPEHCPPRVFTLTGTTATIGRRHPGRGIEPEIDLTGPPRDPGISTVQAYLLARPEGGWDVLDPGSTNGVVLGAGVDPIPAHERHPIGAGEPVHLGAWTTLRLVPVP